MNTLLVPEVREALLLNTWPPLVLTTEMAGMLGCCHLTAEKTEAPKRSCMSSTPPDSYVLSGCMADYLGKVGHV